MALASELDASCQMHETLDDCRSLQFGDLQVSDVSELLVLYYLMRQQKIADTKAALANVPIT